MTGIPELQTPFSLVLHNPDGVDHAPVIMDVFPKRWHLHVPLGEALLTVLSAMHFSATLLSNSPYRAWSISGMGDMQTSGYQNQDFAFEPGAFFTHTGTPLDHWFHIRATQTDILLPDGSTIPKKTFSNSYWHSERWNSSRNADLLKKIIDSLHAKPLKSTHPYSTESLGTHLLLGAIQTLTSEPYRRTLFNVDTLFNASILCATILPCMKHLSPKSPKPSIEAMNKWLEPLAELLFTTWTVRPNRGYNATHFLLGNTYPELLDHTLYPDLVVLGRALFAHYEAFHLTPKAILNPSLATSGHDSFVLESSNAEAIALAHQMLPAPYLPKPKISSKP